MVVMLLNACAPLSGPRVPAEGPVVVEPSATEPPVLITPVPIDPMAEVQGDKPLPIANGAVEQIDCLNGLEQLHARMALRTGHFMPASLLQSQLDTLEPLGPDEVGAVVDITPPLIDVVTQAAEVIHARTSSAGGWSQLCPAAR